LEAGADTWTAEDDDHDNHNTDYEEKDDDDIQVNVLNNMSRNVQQAIDDIEKW
jgi:hypothetical protein